MGKGQSARQDRAGPVPSGGAAPLECGVIPVRVDPNLRTPIRQNGLPTPNVLIRCGNPGAEVRMFM